MRGIAWLVGVALAGVARADVAAVELTGRLDRGARRVQELPAQEGGFWHLVLQGDGAADLDLEALGAGSPGWGSRRVGAREELLVPARSGLKALVLNYGGGPSEWRLQFLPVAPGAPLTEGGAVPGRVDGEARWAVHALPARTRGFLAARLRAPEGASLALHLHAADFAREASAAPGEALVLGPRQAPGWLVVEARGPDACAWELTLEATGGEASDLPPEGLALEVADAPRDLRLELDPQGPTLLRLEGAAADGLQLAVHGPDGLRRASAGGRGAKLVALPPGREACLVRVLPARGAGGACRVTRERLDVASLAPARGDGARTWALVIGVSAYAQASGLRYPASDALRVLETLRRERALGAGQAVVLLDRAATRAAVVGALEAIAARARPQDTLLFFFSGHGDDGLRDGAHGDPADEPDGDDELLVCHDSRRGGGGGGLCDDDLRALLDRVPCGRQVLLIDACYAGGFAELCDAPGRFGIFSSQEGELSAEATRYGTGLLTGVLLRGLAGAADADRDGRLSSGELGRFVAGVVPVTCPISQDRLSPADVRCRGCGRDVTRDGARQVPVVAGQGDLLLLPVPE